MILKTAAGICTVLLALALPVAAQPTKKTPRIAYLSGGGTTVSDAFKQGLRELGYIEGKTITIEYRSAGGKSDRLPALAAEIVRSNPDVIVASGTPAARAVKDATSVIPIVVSGAGDLVGRGIVASLARPAETSPARPIFPPI